MVRLARGWRSTELRIECEPEPIRPSWIALASARAWSVPSSHHQAVLPGVEHLEPPDESSSERPILGAGAQRRVPPPGRMTIPLAEVSTERGFRSLRWPAAQGRDGFDLQDRKLGCSAAVGCLWPEEAKGGHGGSRSAP
ncbi:MAG: hypothetical protein N2109_10845 [Fimbriimonadales bacterium]|nr:hypothetical protein [Fimbriimonadales bacterium]